VASRRIKSTINNSYIQPLKLCIGRKIVIAPSSNYNSILFTKKHRSCSNLASLVNLNAKFDSQNFNGIFTLASLEKSGNFLTLGNTSFKLYLIDTTENWNETLIAEKPATITNNLAKCHFSQTDLGIIDADGEFTFAVEVEIIRLGKIYKKRSYFNHLGVYESVFKLKQEVEFLDITKVDE
jgi:hypothetical protein